MSESFLAALTALHFQFTPIHQYKVLHRANNRNGGVQVFKLDAQSDATELNATVFEFESEAPAQSEKQWQIKRIRALYDDHPEQYFAMVTRKTQCPKEYQIEIGNSGSLEWLRMYANGRNVRVVRRQRVRRL